MPSLGLERQDIKGIKHITRSKAHGGSDMYEEQTLAVHGLPSGDGAYKYATANWSLLTGEHQS